ncbi:MAG: glutaredoxin 3 [Colwellia sp.]
MAKVEIYTKGYCPYCTHAITLLKGKSVDYIEIKIDGNAAMRSTMIKRSHGAYTVPQIFINDVHIGGCDQLVALEQKDQLDALLKTNLNEV